MNKRTFGAVVASTVVTTLLTACSPLPNIAVPTSIPSTTFSATASAKATVSVTPTATARPTGERGAAECVDYQDHVYEACFAYVVNDAHGSLQPYYKYVNSDSLFSGLKNRLALKYFDQALQTIRQRTANWPQGTNTVDGPDITILSAHSSLACNKAVITTRENWTVRTSSGSLLYQENGQLHTVVLHRIPDERFRYDDQVLHQWAVFELHDGIRDIPVC